MFILFILLTGLLSSTIFSFIFVIEELHSAKILIEFLRKKYYQEFEELLREAQAPAPSVASAIISPLNRSRYFGWWYTRAAYGYLPPVSSVLKNRQKIEAINDLELKGIFEKWHHDASRMPKAFYFLIFFLLAFVVFFNFVNLDSFI